jgi:hypothetical protein
MNHPMPLYTRAQLNALRDQAYAEAQALRREAIDDFWRGADHLLSATALQVQRSAQRWTRRLQRRQDARRAQPR